MDDRPANLPSVARVLDPLSASDCGDARLSFQLPDGSARANVTESGQSVELLLLADVVPSAEVVCEVIPCDYYCSYVLLLRLRRLLLLLLPAAGWLLAAACWLLLLLLQRRLRPLRPLQPLPLLLPRLLRLATTQVSVLPTSEGTAQTDVSFNASTPFARIQVEPDLIV